jgi:hypothetical protein
MTSEFPFPECAEQPSVAFSDPMDLIRLLTKEKHQPHAIYWNVEDGIARQVMLFFTQDEGMIVGLGEPHISDEVAFSAIQRVVDGKYGYLTSGSRPPNTIEEFITICQKSTCVNLFDGVIRATHRIA